MAGDDKALFAVFLGAIVMAVGAVVVWIELLVRQAAVYVAVLFLPISIAGIVWPATAHWFKRLVHILVAVVLSKFVIAAILSLAASGLAATGDEGGFGAVLSGGALLTLAAISPLALLRLVPVVEAGVVSSGSVRGGKTGATGSALGGPGWLYGQAKGWMARNESTPAPRTWTRTAGAVGGAGPVGGAVAVATAGGQALGRPDRRRPPRAISQLADVARRQRHSCASGREDDAAAGGPVPRATLRATDPDPSGRSRSHSPTATCQPERRAAWPVRPRPTCSAPSNAAVSSPDYGPGRSPSSPWASPASSSA